MKSKLFHAFSCGICGIASRLVGISTKQEQKYMKLIPDELLKLGSN